jgi:hypothetical protein
VPQGTTHGAFAEEFVAVSQAKGKACCKHCGSERLFRIFREGYLQEKIYPIFGYYPWRCKACKRYMMLRKRKNSRSKAKEYAT